MVKKISAILLSSLLLMMIGVVTTYAQKETVEGYWLSQDKDAKVEIYKAKDGKFYGKIIWLKEPNRDGKPKLDIKNPTESARNTPLMGMLILKSFTKDSDKEYDDGTIYDPKSGKKYSCTITVKDANTLSIRGYVGISLIGRTTAWTRTNP